MARFQFFSPDRQTTDRRLTDKTDCLTPLRACARGVITTGPDQLGRVAPNFHTKRWVGAQGVSM